jgi:hypothetical protein
MYIQMSGQPLRTPLDASKFREAYMANLDLRARLDDLNLQANKTYDRTGQLPVEPSDFRTAEEKLADLSRLRIEVRQRLGEIADGQQANKIAQLLTQKELQFYATQYPEINAVIKPKYALGVLADIFIPFIQNYMTNTSANNGVSSGLQQVTGANMLLSGQNISRNLARSPEYAELLAEAPELDIPITLIESVIPQVDLYDKINAEPDADKKQQLYQEANNLVSNLPTKTDIKRAILDIRRIKNVRTIDEITKRSIRDENAYDVALGKVIQLITPTNDAPIQHRKLFLAINSIKSAGGKKKVVGRPPSNDMRSKAEEYLAGMMRGDADEDDEDDDEIRLPPLPPSKTGKKSYTEVFDTASKVMVAGKGELIDKLGEIRAYYPRFIPQEDWDEVRAYNKKNLQKWVIDYPLKDLKKIIGISGMKGRGVGRAVVSKVRGDVIAPSSVNWEGGVKVSHRFVPFGRYIINSHRLQDDIVAIKRPRGGCLKDFPSTRISRRLGAVIRNIVGGGVPTFNDLDELDDNERAYLHKLAKESNILERLSIPAPKKSEIDKELNDFEIMKGEIIAGNDNKELIKKFKMLILKLSNKNIIPKPQVRELLFDLTNMGY